MMEAIRRLMHKRDDRRDGDLAEAFQKGIDRGNRQMMLFDSEAFRTHPTDDTIEIMYNRMAFCVVCGAALEAFVIDIKECPKGCSRSYPQENSAGLPVITFELIGD